MFGKKKETELKKWHAFVLIIILIFAVVLGIVQRVNQEEEIYLIDVILNEETCSISGGAWDACGSACRENSDTVCIQVCVEYCGCESDVQCPFGFSCVKFVDDIGVCEPSG